MKTKLMTICVLAAVLAIGSAAQAGEDDCDYCSLAFDSTGKPFISYHFWGDGTGEAYGNALRVAQKDETWTHTDIDNANQAGYYGTSIVVDPNTDYPAVAYTRTVSGSVQLYFKEWTGAAWGARVVVDSAGATLGWRPSLAFNPVSGEPAVSYYSKCDDSLKFAQRNGGWSSEQVDDPTGEMVGDYSSLSFYPTTGYPAIAYLDSTNDDIKYAEYNGTGWDIEVAADHWYSSVTYYGYASMKIHPTEEMPYLCYRGDYSSPDLMFTKKSGEPPDWQTETTVDSETVLHCSLAFDSSGYPCIAYFTSSERKLRYASYNGSTWSSHIVDDLVEAPEKENDSLSLAFDPNTGYPAIAYIRKWTTDDYSDLYYASFNGTGWDKERVDGDYMGEPVEPETIHVPADYPTIQEALDAANAGDTIQVAAGTYTENITWPATSDINLVGSGQSSCIIDGNSTASVIRITGSSIDTGTRISGFTIRNGYADGSYPEDSGGGMYCGSGSSPTIENCTFKDNSAEFGGGMSCDESSAVIRSCVFIENTAGIAFGGYGGGLDCYDSAPTLIGCTFTGNSSDYGGGLYCSDSDPTMTNCILWSNTAGQGPQIHTTSSSPDVTYCNVENGDELGYVYGHTGNIWVDPCFADVGTGDIHLQDGSPCIDTGYNGAVTSDYDIDGDPRILDGDDDETATVDMGADEFSYASIGDFDYNFRVDFADFAVLAAAWQSTEGDDANWNPLCNLAAPDDVIDIADLAVFCDNWLVGTE